LVTGFYRRFNVSKLPDKSENHLFEFEIIFCSGQRTMRQFSPQAIMRHGQVMLTASQ
jgi:hypothetical protein